MDEDVEEDGSERPGGAFPHVFLCRFQSYTNARFIMWQISGECIEIYLSLALLRAITSY